MVPIRAALTGLLIILFATAGTTRAQEPAQQQPPPLGKGLVTLLRALNVEKKVSEITDKVLSDPEVMRQMTELADDEQVREVLNDPDVTSALEKNDYLKLLRNPKVLALTRNKKLMDLAKTVAAKLRD